MYSISYIYISQSAVVQLVAIRIVAPPSNFELRVCIKDIHCMRTIWSEFGVQKNPLPEGKGLICRVMLSLITAITEHLIPTLWVDASHHLLTLGR